MATRLAAIVKSAGEDREPRSWAFFAWLAVLVVLLALGLYSFARQTADGHYLTGLNDAAPWGLYVMGFIFTVGVAAGATVIPLLVHAFGRQDYARLVTRAILIGLLSLVASMMFIAVDVGRLERMFALPWVWQNDTSMLTYTSISYYVLGIILVGQLYYAIKVTRGSSGPLDRRLSKWLAILAFPFAVALVLAPDGALFAVVKSRGFWNNSLLPAHTAVVALVSAVALMILVAVVTSWLRERELVGKGTLAHMGGLLAVSIAITGFLDLFDFIVTVYGDRPEGKWAWHFLDGDYLAYSVLHVAGLAVSLVILVGVLTLRRQWLVPGLLAASAIALVALAAYRYNLTVVGLAVPLLPFIGEHQYLPSKFEISVSVGILAFTALAYSALTRTLPMEEDAPPRAAEKAAPAPSGLVSAEGGGAG